MVSRDRLPSPPSPASSAARNPGKGRTSDVGVNGVPQSDTLRPPLPTHTPQAAAQVEIHFWRVVMDIWRSQGASPTPQERAASFGFGGPRNLEVLERALDTQGGCPQPLPGSRCLSAPCWGAHPTKDTVDKGTEGPKLGDQDPSACGRSGTAPLGKTAPPTGQAEPSGQPCSPSSAGNQEDPGANYWVATVSRRGPAQEQDRVKGPSKELSFHRPPKRMFRGHNGGDTWAQRGEGGICLGGTTEKKWILH